MKILITGIAGFVGSSLAIELRKSIDGCEIFGIDNFLRNGSRLNVDRLASHGVSVTEGDIRDAAFLETLPEADWMIDAAAVPSVMAGVDGVTSPADLVAHNLIGTLNLLEWCRKRAAGFLMLSTSRVYSVKALQQIPLKTDRDRPSFVVDESSITEHQATYCGTDGITEQFSTESPISLYGATKLSSEVMAAEYGQAFGFPVRINRCGVLAGGWQFGKADQGIFSFWIHSHRARARLRYLGFGGKGLQVRDCLHPSDLARLICTQFAARDDSAKPIVCNVSGGATGSCSLAELTQWCDERFGKHDIKPSDESRPFDIPWVVLDSGLAKRVWDWEPQIELHAILDEIAIHAQQHPDWLEISR